MVAVPITFTRLSHALTIRARGRIIGAIHSWAPSQGRTIDTEFEVGPNERGLPRDLVPQTIERRELRVSRYDLYTDVMEEVFGDSELVNLTDQTRPFSLRESWTAPGAGAIGTLFNVNLRGPTVTGAFDGLGPSASASAPTLQSGLDALKSVVTGAKTRHYEYRGCWFQDIGRTIDAKADRTVSVEASLVYLERIKVI